MSWRSDHGDAYLGLGLVSFLFRANAAPMTSLTRGAHAGDTSIFCDPTAAVNFQTGMLLWFLDGGPGLDSDQPEVNIAENVNPDREMPGPIPVLDVNDTTGEVSLDYRGRAWTGLQQDHASGSLIGANVIDAAIGDDALMLDGGWPSISIFIDAERVNVVASPLVYRSLRTVWLQYDILTERPTPRDDAHALDKNLWGRDQQLRARLDCDAIKGLLLGDPLLMVNMQPHAEDMGDGSGLVLTKDWGRINDEATGTQPRLRMGAQLIVRTKH